MENGCHDQSLAAGLAEAEQNGGTRQRGDHREVQWPNHWAVFFLIAWVKWTFCLNKMCHNKKRKQETFRIISSVSAILAWRVGPVLPFFCCSLMCVWCTFHWGSWDAGKSPRFPPRGKKMGWFTWEDFTGSATFPTMVPAYSMVKGCSYWGFVNFVSE